MDLSYSEEQQLLKDSVARFVREYPIDARRKRVASDLGYDEGTWKQMAELGWLGVALPEEFGGIGGGPVETMILMEGIGQGLVVEPYFASVVLGGTLVTRGGSDEQKSTLLPALAAGQLKLAFAYFERQARYDLFDVETTARRDGDSYVLDGQKGVVLHAGVADKIVVSARTSGDRRDARGISLFLVDRDAAGLSLRDYRTVDGLRAAEMSLNGVRTGAGAVLGKPDDALPLIDEVADRAIAALAAEAVGCMQVLHDTTNEYLKTRKQFGRPIGKFQVLQHRMVDMFIALEEARSLTLVATLKADEPATERARACAAAKVQIGKSARFVGQQSVQLHGGMGMTDELHIGHYFKRLSMIETMFGDHDHHLRRFADMSLGA